MGNGRAAVDSYTGYCFWGGGSQIFMTTVYVNLLIGLCVMLGTQCN